MTDILADSERLKAMGERAAHLAKTVYGWDAIASRTIELYQCVVKEGSHGLQKGVRCFL
jgi:hypothetical protein